MTAVRIDWPAVRSAASFQLAIPRTPMGGRLGERLGAGTGSSLEFQDYRQYVPGDDLRHVDWAAYARSGSLNVRLYREEVAPRVDIMLDVSRSMTVTDEKARAFGDIAGLIAHTVVRPGADARVITSVGHPHRVMRAEEIEPLLICDAATSAMEGVHLPFRRRSQRVVVSDFLFPHDPDILVNRLARDGSWLAMIQLTLPEEAEPGLAGGQRLVDVEGRGTADLVLDEVAVREYRARFNRLRSGLSTAARRVGARFAWLRADHSIRDVAKALSASGILEPV